MSSGAAPTIVRRDKTAKREAIILIAKDIFLREGYSATSMATIAAAVGGSKATLYNHFPSKEDLFTAVVSDICEGNAAAFSALDLQSPDIRKALRSFGVAIVRFMMSDDVIAMHRLIAGEAARFPEIGQAYYQAAVQLGKQKLIDRFGAAMDSGRLRKTDPSVAAQHFFDLCLAGLYRRRLWNIGGAPSDAEIDANVASAVAAFMDGYASK